LGERVSDRYQSGSTTGGKWGCAVAALIGIPLTFLAILVSALGDCMPDVDCKRGLPERYVIPSLLIAAIAGLGTRAFVNWLARRNQAED
jgi:hypothetical protein